MRDIKRKSRRSKGVIVRDIKNAPYYVRRVLFVKRRKDIEAKRFIPGGGYGYRTAWDLRDTLIGAREICHIPL